MKMGRKRDVVNGKFYPRQEGSLSSLLSDLLRAPVRHTDAHFCAVRLLAIDCQRLTHAAENTGGSICGDIRQGAPKPALEV